MTIWGSIAAFFTRQLRIDGTTLPFTPLGVVTDVLLPFAVAIFAYFLLVYALRRLLTAFGVRKETAQSVVHWSRVVLRLLVVATAVLLVVSLFGARIGEFLGIVLGFLNQPIYASGSTRISLLTIILALPVFYAASWLSRVLRHRLERTILARMNIDTGRRYSIASLSRYVMLVLFALIGLSILGLNLSSIAVILGVLGIGVGFGLQNVVANFFAGIVIFVTRPIKVGDRILVNGYEGEVVYVRLVASVINTLTNETLIIPNSQIVSNVVHNFSFEDHRIIIVNSVQVAYGSNLDEVGEVLRGVGAANRYRIDDKDPEVLYKSFDDSGITVELRTWIHSSRDKMKALSWNNLEIWRSFAENGIEIPFPQMDVHMKNTPGPEGAGGKPGRAGTSPDDPGTATL